MDERKWNEMNASSLKMLETKQAEYLYTTFLNRDIVMKSMLQLSGISLAAS